MQEVPNTLLEFKKLGYVFQLPNSEGQFYYLVKQTNDGARQIFIKKTGSKAAQVEVIQDYKNTNPDKKEEDLLQKFILEDLGLSQYQYI